MYNEILNHEYCWVLLGYLTHLPLVPHQWTGSAFGSDNGLSPDRRQAITWTNTDLLSVGPLGTNLNEIWIKIKSFSFMKMHLKMSVKWQPFCPGEDELIGVALQVVLKCMEFCQPCCHSGPLSELFWYSNMICNKNDLSLSLFHGVNGQVYRKTNIHIHENQP